MKKLISLILIFSMLLGLMPLALAGETADGETALPLSCEETYILPLTDENAVPGSAYSFRVKLADEDACGCDWYLQICGKTNFTYIGSTQTGTYDFTVDKSTALAGFTVRCEYGVPTDDGTETRFAEAVIGLAPQFFSVPEERLTVDSATRTETEVDGRKQSFYTVSAGITADRDDCTYQWFVKEQDGTVIELNGCDDPAPAAMKIPAAYVENGDFLFCRATAPCGVYGDSEALELRLSDAGSTVVKAYKRVLTADDKTEDGTYLYRLTVYSDVALTERVWLFREKGSLEWHTVPAEAENGDSIEFLLGEDTADIFAGIEFRCVGNDGEEPCVSAPVCITVAPEITKDLPELVYTAADKTAEISCEITAKGFGELRYRWLYAAADEVFTADVTALPSYTYTFTPEQLVGAAEDGLRLFCEVEDAAGSVTASGETSVYPVSAPVIVNDLPESYFYKLNEYDAENGSYTGHRFAVSAEGTALTYEWYVSTDNGSTWNSAECVKSAITPCLAQADCFTDGSFLIKAIVTAGGLLSTETTACLCRRVPLITRDLPADIYVNADTVSGSGEDKYFTVSTQIEADGCSELTYKWYFWDPFSGSFGAFREIENAADPVLTDAKLPANTVYMNTAVKCTVTDAFGNETTSSAARIVPVHGVRLTLPETIGITEDDLKDGVYTCSLHAGLPADADTAPVYSWYCRVGDGDWIKAGGDTADIEIPLTEDALLQGAQIKVCGDILGNIRSESEPCTIKLAPYFKNAPAVTDAPAGSTGTIRAEAFSSEELTYQWYRYHREVEYDEYYAKDIVTEEWLPLSNGSVYSGCDTAVLSVVISDDILRQHYRCVVSDGEHEAVSETAKFTKSPIVITGQLKDASVVLGGTAEFSVTAEGMDLAYKWEMLNPSTSKWDTATAIKGPTLRIKADSVKAFDYRFRCTVSDGDKSVVSNEAKLIRSYDILKGDVDLNGKVDAFDARLALRASVHLENYAPGSGNFIAGDWDENGKIDAADARMILRCTVGLA